MAQYSEDYQRCYDIDWFFKYKDYCFHVASNGGKIPDKIDESENTELQRFIEKIIMKNENKEEVDIVQNPRHLNYSTFIDFASIGFISLDRIGDSFESQYYKVIAKPRGEKLPPKNIVDKLPEIRIDTDNRINTDNIHIYDIEGHPIVLE